MAKEQRLYKPNAHSIVSRYPIGNASVARKGLDSLGKKEMILHNISVEIPYYELYDKFLMRWLQGK